MRPQISSSQFIVIVGTSAVLFFLSLIPLELIPEIPVDIDQKAFFVPFLLAALLPVGRGSLAVGIGMALGEGIRDLMEGYEIDDAFGFVGYIVCCIIFGYLVGFRPLNRLVLGIGAVVAASAQAAFEAASLLLFGSEALSVALYAWIGNTITHGVIGGAIPLVLLVPVLHGRFERFLGFAPKGTQPATKPLEARTDQHLSPPAEDDVLQVRDLAFRYPGMEKPALDGISFGVRRGEVLGLLGPLGAGKTTLCLCLAGLAPRSIGGEIVGNIRIRDIDPQTASAIDLCSRVTLVAENVSAQLTQVQALDEVAAPLVNRGVPRDEARRRAGEVLKQVGVPDPGRLERRRTWDLSDGERRRLVLAAALACDPDVLMLDSVADGLDPQARDILCTLIRETAQGRSVLIVENDADLLLEVADRVAVLIDGRLRAIGPASEILADQDLLTEAGYDMPLRMRLAQAAGAPSAESSADDLRRHLAGKTGGNPLAAGSAPGTAKAIPDAAPILAFDQVSFTYEDGTQAARDIDIRLHAGRTYGLLGPNGAGKTTFARLATGLLTPQEGRVRLAGDAAADQKGGCRAPTIGLALQNPDESISERSVRAEMAFPLRRRGERDEHAIDRRVEELAGLVSLPRRMLDADPTALSYGQRKLVAIATAMALDPQLLILDEPSAGLDGAGRRNLDKVVARLQEAGKAVLIMDHNSDLLSDMAERIFLLQNGAIIGQGAPADLFAPTAWGRLGPGISPPRAARLAHSLGLRALTANNLLTQVKGMVA